MQWEKKAIFEPDWLERLARRPSAGAVPRQAKALAKIPGRP